MNNQIIKQAIININIMSNTRQKELDTVWKTIMKDEVDNLPNGISKKGATKELNALIKAFEEEIKDELLIEEETIDLFVSTILEYYEYGTNEEMKILFEPLNEIANLKNISHGKPFFSFNEMAITTFSIIQNILLDIKLIKKHKKRFFETTRLKKQSIDNLEQSIVIAKRFNNQALIFELETMISQIQDENLITDRIIYKSCFFGLHKTLSEKFSSTTKAKNIANQLLLDFFNINEDYKPTKNIVKKDFYEHGYSHPRSFYYYKS